MFYADPIDVSRAIASSSTVYEGDDQPALATICEIGPDAPCHMQSLVNWTTHLLTHVDAPMHFIEGGPPLDCLSLARFYCSAVVVAVSGSAVSIADVPSSDIRGKAVLFKTRNSELDETDPFDSKHVYIEAETAVELVSRGANMVGIDYLSVDRYGDEEYPVHRTLLGADVLILEGLILRNVDPGSYFLAAPPLKISGADGSPVRASLFPVDVE